MSAEQRIAELVALARSVVTYHGDPRQKAAMDTLYRQFVLENALVFDVGSHVGDRIASFRRLGARVVALEPQPGPAGIIEQIFGADRMVTSIRAAAGRRQGEIMLKINSLNPTVSTASAAFVAAADGAAGWEGQRWDREVSVPVTTLDALIARNGLPSFIKIDVEGFEAEVVAGLSRPVPALSFEFTTIQRGVALSCLDRLQALGNYRFNLALGESQTLTQAEWADAAAMARLLTSLPHEANSGDVYARLEAR